MPIRPVAKVAGFMALLVGGNALSSEPALETIVVTGTRVPRPGAESASPTVVVPNEALRQTGAVTVERALNELPQFVPTATGTSNDPSNDGQANVSLRGLGASQTLVLLDGRRLMPADGRGAVDVNVLPAALIDHVEVVTGGAAAVYGSDAIAGVVNFRLRDSFDGIELDAGWSQTARGDGSEYSIGMTAGTQFAGGRGSFMGHVSYSDRALLRQSDRGPSRYPLEYVPETGSPGSGAGFVPSGNGIVEEGLAIVFADPAAFQSLFEAYGYPAGSVPYQAGFGVNDDGTVFTIGDGTPHSVANFRGDKDPVLFNDRAYNTYNYATTTALQMPLERTSAFARLDLAFSDTLEGYLQILAANYEVTRQLAPVAAGIVLVPPTNPHISADLGNLLASRVNPDAPFRYFKRLTELGPRQLDNHRDLQQLSAGLAADVSERWAYEAYVQIGRNRRTERQTDNLRLSRLEDLTFAPDAGASICGDFDPFPKLSLPAECVSYLAVDASNHVAVDRTIIELSATGVLGATEAHPVRVAFGIVHKRDAFHFNADPLLSTVLPAVPGVIGPRPDLGGLGLEAATDRGGSESNTDVYGELFLPLLTGTAKPSLDIGLGYRYSDYDRAGGVSAYKGELSLKPVGQVRLRGSYQHTVRAPSIEELFYPPVSNQFEINPPDPCSASSAQRTGPNRAAVEALCLAQGVPAALLPGFEYPLRRVDGVAGGNPDLQPEQADTYTLGLILTHGDARASIDWYRIDINDGIGRWEAASAVDRCFDPAFNPAFTPSNIYCSFFERRPDTGTIFALILDRNVGGLRTSGVDLEIDWHVGAGPGLLEIRENLTYVQTWQYRDPSGGTIDYAGTIGGGGLGRSLPRWKSILNLGYGWNALTLTAQWHHISASRDADFRDFTVPPRDYLDLSASFELDVVRNRSLLVRAGIENVSDEDPPIFPSWQQANTDPSQYDVLGRRYYLALTYRL